jgi:hypothetical protein
MAVLGGILFAACYLIAGAEVVLSIQDGSWLTRTSGRSHMPLVIGFGVVTVVLVLPMLALGIAALARRIRR